MKFTLQWVSWPSASAGGGHTPPPPHPTTTTTPLRREAACQFHPHKMLLPSGNYIPPQPGNKHQIVYHSLALPRSHTHAHTHTHTHTHKHILSWVREQFIWHAENLVLDKSPPWQLGQMNKPDPACCLISTVPPTAPAPQDGSHCWAPKDIHSVWTCAREDQKHHNTHLKPSKTIYFWIGAVEKVSLLCCFFVYYFKENGK